MEKLLLINYIMEKIIHDIWHSGCYCAWIFVCLRSSIVHNNALHEWRKNFCAIVHHFLPLLYTDTLENPSRKRLDVYNGMVTYWTMFVDVCVCVLQGVPLQRVWIATIKPKPSKMVISKFDFCTYYWPKKYISLWWINVYFFYLTIFEGFGLMVQSQPL